MSGDVQVRFCESVGVRFPGATHLLVRSPARESALQAECCLRQGMSDLRLQFKCALQADLLLRASHEVDATFTTARQFRHLGLLFREDGGVALSRDKSRKIQNLFRFAFRRARRRWNKIAASQAKAQALADIAAESASQGVRNVAILDYYLKHVDDEKQLQRLDRWLAEEVLSHVFDGHKKGHFRRISFEQLRALGLPSLVHRRRLIRRGKIESSFFIWQRHKITRAFRGTVARLHCAERADVAFSPLPEAAASKVP